jgi:uncharacterized protein
MIGTGAGAIADAGDRIVVVDALRAFALFGIIVTHACIGFLVGLAPDPDFMRFSELDRIVMRWVPILIEGKFFAIFSFLFGLSFAIQLERARRAGRPFAGRFAWRLVVLFGIGFVHSFFFAGDILMIYAVLGLLLLPVHRLRTRTLLVTALILVLNVPGLVLGSLFVTAAPPSTAEEQQAQQEQFTELAGRQYEIKRDGTVGELIELNLTEGTVGRVFYLLFTGRLWMTYGFFLLGLCAGRARLFVECEASRRFFRRLLIVAGIAAAVATVPVVIYPFTFERTLQNFLIWYVGSAQHSMLAAFYVSAVTLLLWKPAAAWLTRLLAPMGKAGLTTYLSQSAFGILVYYGIGLGMLGVLGAATSIALATCFYVLQLFIARWWLRHFRFGPVEWLWRSLTDLRLHPLRQPATQSAA